MPRLGRFGLIGAIGLVGAWFSLAFARVWVGPPAVTDGADVAVVLGAAVYTDRPSPVFRARIDHGIDLLESGRVTRIVFTGGKARGDRISEAECARHYALERGIAASSISIETRSTTTRQNLREARHLIAPGERVALVTDPLHMRRALTLAHRAGLDAIPAPTPYTRYRTLSAKLPFAFRESWFYACHLLGL